MHEIVYSPITPEHYEGEKIINGRNCLFSARKYYFHVLRFRFSCIIISFPCMNFSCHDFFMHETFRTGRNAHIVQKCTFCPLMMTLSAYGCERYM